MSETGKPHICLIVPPTGYATGRKPQFLQKLYVPPPRILYLCAALKRAGYQVTVYDLPSLGWRLDRVMATLGRDEREKVICITSTTISYPYAEVTGQMLREMGQFVIMGGEHSTFAPAEVLRNQAADVCVLGEGEHTLVEVLERYKDNGWPEVRGIAFARNGEIVANPPRPPIQDLDGLGPPDYESFPVGLYLSRGGKVSVNLMRGCDFCCEFCLISRVHPPPPRYRSTEAVIEELKHLRDKYGLSRFAFNDPTFALDRGRVVELCERLLREDLRLSWSCTTRMNTIDPDLLALMRSSGCETILFGVETFDPQLKWVSAKHSVSVGEVFSWARSSGICFLPSFIMGLPGEDKESSWHKFQAAIDLVEEFGLDEYQFNTIAPFPGTQLQRQGLIHVNPRIPYSYYCIVPAHYSEAFPAQDFLLFWNKVVHKVFPEYYYRYLELEEQALQGYDPYLKYYTSGARAGRPENLGADGPVLKPAWQSPES